jgi:uncharacterized protein involved in exopolysaccharide biosynthesis
MEDRETISFTLLFQALVNRRRIIAALITGGLLLSILLAFTIPKSYTAYATLLPSGKAEGLGTFGNALSLMKIGLDMEVPPNSSFLFPTIIKSRRIMEQILSSRFEVEGSEKSMADIIGKSGYEESLEALDKIIRVRTDKKTGIIRILATTRNPDLSSQIVNRTVCLLERFSGEKRRTKAWLDYQFILKELSEVEEDLFEAEEELTVFERNHRDIHTSTDPKVIMEHKRLICNLQLQHELYVDLTKQAELADIELKKETPLVKVLDEASPPQLKSGPRRKMIVLLGGAASLFIGITVALTSEVPVSVMLRRILGDPP